MPEGSLAKALGEALPRRVRTAAGQLPPGLGTEMRGAEWRWRTSASSTSNRFVASGPRHRDRVNRSGWRRSEAGSSRLRGSREHESSGRAGSARPRCVAVVGELLAAVFVELVDRIRVLQREPHAVIALRVGHGLGPFGFCESPSARDVTASVFPSRLKLPRLVMTHVWRSRVILSPTSNVCSVSQNCVSPFGNRRESVRGMDRPTVPLRG